MIALFHGMVLLRAWRLSEHYAKPATISGIAFIAPISYPAAVSATAEAHPGSAAVVSA
jgi:hypothetical protein